MIVIPAIDLIDGKCVRLIRGDYSQVTIFGDYPTEVAKQWEDEGARWLHVIDLDGASAGQPVNLDVVRSITDAISIPVQLGGGIRTIEAIETCLQAGVKRVLLGTVAVEDEALVAQACLKYGEAISVAVDAKDGLVATRGWRRTTSISAIELVKRVRELGVSRILYTDISRDGTLTEPNFQAISELMSCVEIAVIAAGGVSSLEHLLRLRELGVEGAIVGRALYSGDLSLPQALAIIEQL